MKESRKLKALNELDSSSTAENFSQRKKEYERKIQLLEYEQEEEEEVFDEWTHLDKMNAKESAPKSSNLSNSPFLHPCPYSTLNLLPFLYSPYISSPYISSPYLSSSYISNTCDYDLDLNSSFIPFPSTCVDQYMAEREKEKTDLNLDETSKIRSECDEWTLKNLKSNEKNQRSKNWNRKT